MSAFKFCEPRVKHEFHKSCIQVTPLQGAQQQDSSEDKNKKGEGGVKKPKKVNESILDKKETIAYFSNEGMKRMIVPSKEPNYYPLKIKDEEFDRLKAKAVVISEKEKLKIVEDAKAEQSRLEHESAVRKNELKQYDKKGKKGGPGRLSALEREARDKANYLLKRAWELRKEDEGDVKKANSLILQAKCQAIRDAQLAEHRLIQKELKEEDKRIEQMMEDERTRQVIEEKKRVDEERAKKLRYVKELNEQVDEIEAHRILDAERLIEERKKANEAMFVVMLEELENVRKEQEEKKKIREFLNLSIEQAKRAQEMEREEERLTELKIQEFMRMKAEREEKFEREKEIQRKKREMEDARFRANQEAARDLQAIQDEMAAVRRQEEYEREWRRKEKEAAKKKLRLEEDCKLAREQQIRDIRKTQAMEIAREKREFERNLQIQIEIQEKERLLELKKKHEAEIYREQILKQINMKEKERIEERQEKFQEGIALRAEEAKRKFELKQILEKKLEVVRQHKIPDVYVAQIERQLSIT